jgi:hypothetical protein
MDRIEPAEPIDRMDPVEPIDRIDPLEPRLRSDPARLCDFSGAIAVAITAVFRAQPGLTPAPRLQDRHRILRRNGQLSARPDDWDR